MKGNKFDLRLDCLMKVINEDWIALEAKEVDGDLVVRVRDGEPRSV